MGAPWKCKSCGCKWYSAGTPNGYCWDCGSDDIDIDFKKPRKPQQAVALSSPERGDGK